MELRWESWRGAVSMLGRRGRGAFNLLPLHLRYRAGRRRLRPWLAMAAGLAMAALVPLIEHQRKLHHAAHEQNVALERELAPLRARAARHLEVRQRQAEADRQEAAWRKIAEVRIGWLGLLGEIQAKFVSGGEVWLERMEMVVPPAENGVVQGTAVAPMRIAFAGLIRSKAGNDSYERVRTLLTNIAEIPLVAAVESERFEPASLSAVRFNFVVVLREGSAL